MRIFIFLAPGFSSFGHRLFRLRRTLLLNTIEQQYFTLQGKFSLPADLYP